MSVKKRVYSYTDDDGRTRTREVWRARVWTYPPHGPRKEVEDEFETWKAAKKWEGEQREKARGRTLDVERTTLADAGLWERAESRLRARLAPKTFDHYRRGWHNRVLVTLGSVKLGQLTTGAVEHAAVEWARAGAGASTVRQARLALSAVLAVAVSDGLLPVNVAAVRTKPKRSGGRQKRKVGKTMRPEQLAELVDGIRALPAGETYAVMVDLMGTAALRYGEAAGLHVGDVDFDRGVIELQRQVTEVSKDELGESLKDGYWRDGNLVWGPLKNGDDRTVPIPLHLVKPIRALTAGRRAGELLFRSERGEKVVRRNTFARKVGWSKRVAQLGFVGFRIHDLRATALTNLLEAGVKLHVVRDIAGHHDMRVTNLYTRPHDDALTLAAAALATYAGGTR